MESVLFASAGIPRLFKPKSFVKKTTVGQKR